ncbi:MAG: cobalamin biosynthesis protein CbiD [Lachnospiraceae bacterium]|nr:cobalamin biosynthesis protein CbiD [Lachnospiraceae bacterium]
MRVGFSTGSCAAAAAKAAATMLFSQAKIAVVRIETLAGIPFEAEILDPFFSENEAGCAVIKDGGDDPDITSGAKVCVLVRVIPVEKTKWMSEEADSVSPEMESTSNKVFFRAGEGVGIVTKPGLDQPVGEAAINSGPRKQIEKEVREVLSEYGILGDVEITISVPEGEKIAQKTFNPKLGIEGGISILGTTGVVKPMSTEALLETIRISMTQRREMGDEKVVVVPGNYGLEALKTSCGIEPENCVVCSNYIGFAIDTAVELGFQKMLLAGHIGKLAKLGLGIMNTHSREADGRLEALSTAAMEAGASAADGSDPQCVSEYSHLECDRFFACALHILQANTAEEAVDLLEKRGIQVPVMKQLMRRIHFYLNKRAEEKMEIECIVFSARWGEIGRTK